jgi:hypothetical protein
VALIVDRGHSLLCRHSPETDDAGCVRDQNRKGAPAPRYDREAGIDVPTAPKPTN